MGGVRALPAGDIALFVVIAIPLVGSSGFVPRVRSSSQVERWVLFGVEGYKNGGLGVIWALGQKYGAPLGRQPHAVNAM